MHIPITHIIIYTTQREHTTLISEQSHLLLLMIELKTNAHLLQQSNHIKSNNPRTMRHAYSYNMLPS